MITLLDACKIIRELYDPSLVIGSIVDIGRGWVISTVCKDTGAPLLVSPDIVYKETGTVECYHLPDEKHFQELAEGKELPVPVH